jgi:DNA-binding transcriptional LysR family regulator
MDNWDEIRTAYQVARLGTVSGAADVLGVHHATVIRHIDALEQRLGVKLFQRHARGYTPTEAGRDLLQVAQTTDDQFTQLLGRIRGRGEGISGDLVVTSLAGVGSLLMPVMVAFQERHPGVTLRYLTGERLFRLEYGEAHVAVRAGPAPDQPDNVVQPLATMQSVLVAHESYIARHGMPADAADLARHWFVGQEEGDNRAPFNRWLTELAPRSRVRFRASEDRSLRAAVFAGAGIGFLPKWEAGPGTGLHEMLPARPDWRAAMWLVTHVDLHRTAKVQAFLADLKEAAKGWRF